MQSIIRWYLLILLLITTSQFNNATPLLPMLGWLGLSAMVEVLLEETLHTFLNPQATPQELQELQQRIESAESYLAQNIPTDAPSAEEVTRLKEKIAQTSALFTATQGKLENLTQRLEALEQNIVTLHAANSNATTVSATKPLAVKISYLYQRGGRGKFKPFQAHATLHSGDHVKIVFTAAEPVYAYLFGYDQTGEVQRLYPVQRFGNTPLQHQNPVVAGAANFVPAEQISLVLNRTTGKETLYFLASREKDTVLESFYNGLETLQQQQPQLQETLHAHRVFVQNILTTQRFEPELAMDTEQVTWQERGESLQAELARIKNFCDGCVQIMEYQHE